MGINYGAHARFFDAEPAGAISANAVVTDVKTADENGLLRVAVSSDLWGSVILKEGGSRDIVIGTVLAGEGVLLYWPVTKDKTYAIHLAAGAGTGEARVIGDLLNA